MYPCEIGEGAYVATEGEEMYAAIKGLIGGMIEDEEGCGVV